MRRTAPKKRPVFLLVAGDPHPGSTLAPCPPEGVRLDDGGTYHPSKAQDWLWECWCDALRTAGERRREAGAEMIVVLNGDLAEGDHHNTSQVISKNPEAQAYVMERVFGQIKDLSPDRVFVVRGTEAHVGSSGSTEEALARRLGAERDEETRNWSRWHLRLDIHGTLNDFQHHGRASSRPWTEMSAAASLALQIYLEHVRRGLRHPDIAWRSHTHKRFDSHDAHPTRVIGVPSFQLKTAYAHKVAPESISQIGMYHALFRENERPTIWDQMYLPALPKVVTV